MCFYDKEDRTYVKLEMFSLRTDIYLGGSNETSQRGGIGALRRELSGWRGISMLHFPSLRVSSSFDTYMIPVRIY